MRKTICFIIVSVLLLFGNSCTKDKSENPTPDDIVTVSSSPVFLNVFKDVLYITADDGIHGDELWVYDGTNDPSLVYDILSGPGSSFIKNTIVFNGKLCFTADDVFSATRISPRLQREFTRHPMGKS